MNITGMYSDTQRLLYKYMYVGHANRKIQTYEIYHFKNKIIRYLVV